MQTLMKKAKDDDADKVLGMEWDTESDTIRFKSRRNNLLKYETTKRQCLSTIYSIYDPIELLAPVTVASKIILRKMWAARPYIDWDGQLPNEIKK